MKLHALILLSVLASQAAYSQGGAVIVNQDGSKSEVKDLNEFMKNPQTKGAAGVVILSDKEAKKERKKAEKQAKQQLKEYQQYLKENDLSGLDNKKAIKINSGLQTADHHNFESLDHKESDAFRIKQLAKKQEEKAKKLKEDSEKLAKKSDNLEDKSAQLAHSSEEQEKEAQLKLQKSQELADEVKNSEFAHQRQEAIANLCNKRIQKAKIFKIFDRKSEEEQIAKCMTEYSDSDIKKKTKMKRAYLGKECTFNPGISIECPEGTYKFISSEGLSNINADDRNEVKDTAFDKAKNPVELVSGAASLK